MADYSHLREIKLGLARYRDELCNWEFILDECWPDHCYQGRAGEGAVVSAMSAKILNSWQRFPGPWINVSNSIGEYPVPSVFCDDHRVGEVAAEHLLEREFASLAFLGNAVYAHSRERLAGFVAAAGKRATVEVYEPPQGRDFFKELFGEHLLAWVKGLPKPIGVLVNDDTLGGRFIDFLLNHGYLVPEDIAVIAVNDDPVECGLARVPLSAVHVDGKSIGYRAAAMLDVLLRGEGLPSEMVRVAPGAVTPRQSTDSVASRDPIIRQGLRFVRNHFHEVISVEDVARFAACSRRVLERHFKEHFGHGPYEEILQARLRKAKQLLADTEMTIETISAACGFAEPNLFFVLFRKREGASPREWRIETRAKLAEARPGNSRQPAERVENKI